MNQKQWNIMPLNIYIGNEWRSWINWFSFHLNKLEKKKNNKPNETQIKQKKRNNKGHSENQWNINQIQMLVLLSYLRRSLRLVSLYLDQSRKKQKTQITNIHSVLLICVHILSPMPYIRSSLYYHNLYVVLKSGSGSLLCKYFSELFWLSCFFVFLFIF